MDFASVQALIEELAKTTRGDAAIFRQRARELAQQLGEPAIEHLELMLHSDAAPPDEVKHQFPALGQWLAAKQFAVFEVFYHLPDAAYPVLRRVAFGVYDWTQANAIEVLLRLAADGYRTEEIVADVREAIPALRDTALLYTFGPLRNQAKSNPELSTLLKRFEDMEEYRETVEELEMD